MKCPLCNGTTQAMSEDESELIDCPDCKGTGEQPPQAAERDKNECV